MKKRKKIPDMLKSIIDEGGYSPSQVFNVDETGLYWKRLPSRTFIILPRKKLQHHASKSPKAGLHMFWAEMPLAIFKLKPLLVYHSENPRVLKNISKTTLPVIWKHNKKAWVTTALFAEWFRNEFCPGIKEYSRKNNLSHKVLLLGDNAPGHPATLNQSDENVKAVFLPPNTTSLLQPMDQGVNATFKASASNFRAVGGFNESDEEDIFDVINTPEVPLSNELLNIVTDDTETQQNLDEREKQFPSKKICKFSEHIEKTLKYLKDYRGIDRRKTVSFSISKNVERYRKLYKS
ncbi:tigger transposable element-derived protein 1-like [Hermetia illucens]|uniref:tigger transposable element-derived protein 1-like n=1 Tax=Hermetia illucens TaxID=343691 RepID=UPI0018CC184A|nr:tigger transposable element-derived protein 1-like [Hermetia illucens]